MMNELQIFKNPEFGQIRSLMIEGEPQFVGRDIAGSLGYAKPENAVKAHVDDEDKSTTPIQGSAYATRVVIINESGLYSLILSSKLPNAKKFKRWVTSEVLPAIRKTGSYTAPAVLPDRKLTADDYLRAASIISTCKNERLPYVLDLLKKSGIKVSQIKTEQHKATAGKDVEGEAQKAIYTAKLVYGITYAEVGRRTGLNRQQIRRIYTGEYIPTLERAKLICDTVQKLISEVEQVFPRGSYQK